MVLVEAETGERAVDATGQSDGDTDMGVSDEPQPATNSPAVSAEMNDEGPAADTINGDTVKDVIEAIEAAGDKKDSGNQPNGASNDGGGKENTSRSADKDAAAEAAGSDDAVEPQLKGNTKTGNEARKVANGRSRTSAAKKSVPGKGADEGDAAETSKYDATIRHDQKRCSDVSGQHLPSNLRKKLPKYKVTVRTITALANAATWFDLHHLNMRLHEAVYSGAPHEPLRIPIETRRCNVPRNGMVPLQIGHTAGAATAADTIDVTPDGSPNSAEVRDSSEAVGAAASDDAINATPDGGPNGAAASEPRGDTAKSSGTDATRNTAAEAGSADADSKVDDKPKAKKDVYTSKHHAEKGNSIEKAIAQAAQQIVDSNDRGAVTDIESVDSLAVSAEANEGAYQKQRKKMTRKQRQFAAKQGRQNQNRRNRDGLDTPVDSVLASPGRLQRFAFVYTHGLITLEGNPEEDANTAKSALHSVVSRVRYEHGFLRTISHNYPLKLRVEHDVEVETGLCLDVKRLHQLAPVRGRDKAGSSATGHTTDDEDLLMGGPTRILGVYAGKKSPRGGEELDEVATTERLVTKFRLGRPEVAVEVGDDGRLLIRHISSARVLQAAMKKLVPMLLQCDPERAQALRKERSERLERKKMEREVKKDAAMKDKTAAKTTAVHETVYKARIADSEEDLVVVEDRGPMDEDSEQKDEVKDEGNIKDEGEEELKDEPKD